jgi:N-acetylmuramoyl-L-alanine amidase
VRLYRSGDEGEAVRDIQDRLIALGFACDPDLPGMFGAGTVSAVIDFQSKRGLWTDGIVGPDTWRALVSAGYRLGSRILYRRVPMMRGDDVAELQRRLNSLGFDTGKVDGIFGPDTLQGLLEFQANRRLAEDGLAGQEVVAELDLMARATMKHGREVVRDHQWLESLPRPIAGQRIYIDPFCRDQTEMDATWSPAVTLGNILQDLGAVVTISRSIDTNPPERVRALRANRLGVDLIVALCLPYESGSGTHFFASQHSSSSAGEALASAIGGCLGVSRSGRAIPILKNTRAPAVVVAVSDMDAQTAGRIAQGLIDLYSGDNL